MIADRKKTVNEHIHWSLECILDVKLNGIAIDHSYTLNYYDSLSINCIYYIIWSFFLFKVIYWKSAYVVYFSWTEMIDCVRVNLLKQKLINYSVGIGHNVWKISKNSLLILQEEIRMLKMARTAEGNCRAISFLRSISYFIWL
jgi:hypothetical protein